MRSPQELHLELQINNILDGAADRIELIDQMPTNERRQIFKLMISYACKSQSIGAITSGRSMLNRIPSSVLSSLILELAAGELDMTDDYEYRRLLELIEISCKHILDLYVAMGRNSGCQSIIDVANEFAP